MNTHFRKLISLMSLWLILSAQTAGGVELGSVANSRFGTNYSLDGSQMDVTRAKLMHSGNFGPVGTFPLGFNITDTAATLDAAELSNYDVFFIGWLDDADPSAFATSELNALWTWVMGGGVLILSCDDTGHDAVCVRFDQALLEGAYTSLAAAPGFGVDDHPIWNGPFGDVDTVSTFGDTSVFLPYVYGERVGVAPDLNTMLSVERVGAGVVIYLSDVNTITDHFLSAGTGISTNNDVFMTNMFAFAAASSLSLGTIETPFNGLFASGIGQFGGWWCDAGEIVVVVDGGTPKPAAYGTSRGDTLGVCGDRNNGWALQFNFGLLGDGVHTVQAFADGELVGTSTFTVTTYGTSFLSGESGDFLLNNFPNPGNSAVYTWSEPNQNLILKSFVP